MKRLHRKKAIALYESKIGAPYVVMTVIMYVVALVLWYIIAAIAPYTAAVNVSATDERRLTRAALSATQAEIEDEQSKPHVLMMPTGENSFLRRLKLAEDAKSTIDFMVHTTYDSDYARYFYTALLRAADRNVKVRIITDGKVGRLDGSLAEMGKLLQNHNNIEFYYFNQVNILNPAGLLVLMHDKVMLADGKIAIVGGANMGRLPYISNFDMEVMITDCGEGGCIADIKNYFNELFADPKAKRIVSKTADFDKKAQYIDEFTGFFGKSEYSGVEINYDVQGVAVDKITYLTNGVVGNKKAPTIYSAICDLGENSENTTFVTPYILIQNDKKRRVNALARSNAEFKLITNSLYNSRNVAYSDYYYTRRAYVNDDIRLLEYQAENQLHAKIYTFDGRFSVIGSFNFDERSCHIDTESVVIIDSAAFTAVLDEYIDSTFVKNSLEVGENNKYIPSDTVAAGAVPLWKRVRFWFFSILGLIRCVI